MGTDSENVDDTIVHRTFDPATTEPNAAVAETIADLEGVDAAELSPLYTTLDHVLDHLYSDPPTPEAQVTITFTYEGYRVTLHQDGSGEFVKVG